MRRLALFSILLILSSALAASEVLVIEMDIDNSDIVELIDMRLMTGSETVSEGTDYSIDLIDGNGVMIHSTNFDVLFTAYGENFPFLPDQEDVGIVIELNKTRVIVRVPYLTNAASFVVKKGTTELLSQDINLCNNNGVCDVTSGENYLSCLADCPSGGNDDLCDEIFDSVCDADCTAQGRSDKDTDCTCGDGTCDGREDSITCAADCGAASNEISNLFMMVIGGGVGLLLIIIIVIVLIIKKAKKKK